MGKILKTKVPKENGTIGNMDTIEHEGLIWLVPGWLVASDKRTMTPLRIVCLSALPHQQLGGPLGDFLLSHPIPESVYRGVIPAGQERQFVVIESPGIVFPNPDVLN